MHATTETDGARTGRIGPMRLFRPRRDHPPPCRTRIENLTGVRIGICFKNNGARCMVLPSFGSREVPTSMVHQMELEQWKCRGLVRLHTVRRQSHGRDWVFWLISLGVWSIPVLGIALLVRPELLDVRGLWAGVAAFWTVVVLAGVIAAVTEPAAPESGDPGNDETIAHYFREQLLGGVYRWVGMALVLTIGMGVPVGLLWAQREVLMSRGVEVSALCQLFLGIFASFVTVVSTLPALLFFLFQQHRQETARTTFFREVMRIDRSLLTVTDAEAIYGLAVNEAHGQARRGLAFNLSLVPVLISTLLMTFGWTAVLLPTLNDNEEHARNFGDMALATLLEPRQTEFTFAFLGAYFFTLGMVFRRYVRADLGPKAYSHVSMRIIAAVVLAWVAAAIPRMGGPDAAEPAAMLLVFAFFVGIVPETGLAVIHDVMRARRNPLSKIIPSLEEKDPLGRLEGITLYDRARLLEEGIENVENLAHHDLTDLMLRTRIPTPRIVDLVDQAILYLHVRCHHDNDSLKALDTLRRIGIRTATGLLEAERNTPAELLPDFYDLLGREGGLPRLQMICISIEDDEWVAQLRHWGDTRTRCDEVLEISDFLRRMQSGSHRGPRCVHPRRTAWLQGTGEVPALNSGGAGHPAPAAALA